MDVKKIPHKYKKSVNNFACTRTIELPENI